MASFTFVKAFATSSVVELTSAITASTSFITASAAFLASLYLSADSFVLPSVTFVISVADFSSFLAVSKPAVSPLSFNKAAALSNSALILSTSICASVASSLPAFASLSNTVLAWAFALFNASSNCLYWALYASILFGVLPLVSAGFNASESFFNLVFCFSVAATTNSALAAFNSALFSLTFATAWATWSTVALSLSIIAFAFLASSSAAVFASLYFATVSGVLPEVGSSSTSLSNSPFEASNADLSTFNPLCVSKASFRRFW